MKKIAFAIILTLIFSGVASAIDFAGTYVMSSGGLTITLVLKQNSQGIIRGTLTSSNGEKYTLNGKIEGDVASGVCNNGVFFTAKFKNDQLVFKLMDPGADNTPNPDTAKKLFFIRTDAATPAEPAPQPAQVAPSPRPSRTPPPVTARASVPTQVSGEEISDPAWGYKFRAPKGWNHQKSAEAAALRHSSVTGVILIFPHQQTGIAQLRADMRNGITEEQIQLRLDGELKNIGVNIIGGNYSGLYQGRRVSARGVATLSPYGGGAIIVGLAESEQFSPELSGASDAVARGMRYVKTETAGGSGGGGGGSGDMNAYFAGTWSLVSATATRSITLKPNGEYVDYSESTNSGQFRNQYGNNTGNWGTASQNQSNGRWKAVGNRERGTITVTYSNGEKMVCQYRVHVEKGKTYWNEYYFCEKLYAKN